MRERIFAAADLSTFPFQLMESRVEIVANTCHNNDAHRLNSTTDNNNNSKKSEKEFVWNSYCVEAHAVAGNAWVPSGRLIHILPTFRCWCWCYLLSCAQTATHTQTHFPSQARNEQRRTTFNIIFGRENFPLPFPSLPCPALPCLALHAIQNKLWNFLAQCTRCSHASFDYNGMIRAIESVLILASMRLRFNCVRHLFRPHSLDCILRVSLCRHRCTHAHISKRISIHFTAEWVNNNNNVHGSSFPICPKS